MWPRTEKAGKVRTLSNGSISAHAGMPWIVFNSAPFYSQESSGVDNKIHGHPTNSLSFCGTAVVCRHGYILWCTQKFLSNNWLMELQWIKWLEISCLIISGPLFCVVLEFPLYLHVIPLGPLQWTVGTQVLKEDRAVWEPGESLAPIRGTGGASALGRNSHIWEYRGH